jgi:hypothetical protein
VVFEQYATSSGLCSNYVQIGQIGGCGRFDNSDWEPDNGPVPPLFGGIVCADIERVLIAIILWDLCHFTVCVSDFELSQEVVHRSSQIRSDFKIFLPV